MARKSFAANHLRKYRKIMGYSQIEVAVRLGHKNSNRICRWEKGVAVPSMENLLKLSLLYKTLPHQFYPDLIQRFRDDLFPQILNVDTGNSGRDP